MTCQRLYPEAGKNPRDSEIHPQQGQETAGERQPLVTKGEESCQHHDCCQHQDPGDGAWDRHASKAGHPKQGPGDHTIGNGAEVIQLPRSHQKSCGRVHPVYLQNQHPKSHVPQTDETSNRKEGKRDNVWTVPLYMVLCT